MITIQLPVKKLILGCIRSSRGKEICGFLLRDDAGDQTFFEIKNLSSNNFSFFISDTDMQRLYCFIQKNNLTVEGFLHSHKDSLDLSKEDINGFSNSPFDWIVVGESKFNLIHRVYYKADFKISQTANTGERAY